MTEPLTVTRFGKVVPLEGMSVVRVGYADLHNLLRLGLAWVDGDGIMHEGQPDFADHPEIFDATAEHPPVRRALLAANVAALEVDALVRALAEARQRAAEAHVQAKIEAARRWSELNAAPHHAAHDEKVRAYFEREDTPASVPHRRPNIITP